MCYAEGFPVQGFDMQDFDRLLDAKPRNIERWQKEKRKSRCNQKTTHHRESHRPPKYGGRNRDQAEHRRDSRQHDRAEARLARLNHSVPSPEPLSAFCLNLLDQDNGVPRDQAEQGKRPEDCHEAQGLPDEQERHDDADEAHWNNA